MHACMHVSNVCMYVLTDRRTNRQTEIHGTYVRTYLHAYIPTYLHTYIPAACRNCSIVPAGKNPHI